MDEVTQAIIVLATMATVVGFVIGFLVTYFWVIAEGKARLMNWLTKKPWAVHEIIYEGRIYHKEARPVENTYTYGRNSWAVKQDYAVAPIRGGAPKFYFKQGVGSNYNPLEAGEAIGDAIMVCTTEGCQQKGSEQLFTAKFKDFNQNMRLEGKCTSCNAIYPLNYHIRTPAVPTTTEIDGVLAANQRTNRSYFDKLFQQIKTQIPKIFYICIGILIIALYTLWQQGAVVQNADIAATNSYKALEILELLNKTMVG